MKLRNLECLCEIVAAGFNLSAAARRLSASQPTVTRQIQLLEREVGYRVLQRTRNKVSGLTPLGATLHEHAVRILQEAQKLKSLPRDPATGSSGRIVVATTHFHAKYTLVEAITALRKRYPKVSFALMPGDTRSIPHLVSTGQADIGISVESTDTNPELAYYPCSRFRRVVIMPKGHPLAKLRVPTVAALARYPIIVYGQQFMANRRVLQVFADHGLTPDVALATADIEVIKTYVAAGVGISVIPGPAFDRARDDRLTATPVDTLFPPVTAMLSVRRGYTLQPYAREFVRMLAPTAEDAPLDSPTDWPAE
jgi:DNA-binding transcriptional LysR family regulator